MTDLVSDTAAGLIRLLDLEPHPEGGHYRETYRHVRDGGGRGYMTAIHYLLQAGEVSRWHRLHSADEIWIFNTGGALELILSPDGQRQDIHKLGLDVARGEQPQILVPRGCWQSARSLGTYTLVTCTVTPAFEFDDFELAPPGWSPRSRLPALKVAARGPWAGRRIPPRGR
ncbi:MAG: cupin domain-containing protein [Rhodospirillaceae bacterium]|nr:cupin domain-containing protein [Rhodospirillaceae bacterium]